MNKNLKQKLKKGTIYASVLFTVATLGVIGGNTYSKYFTKIDGEGSAVVARWSFKANNETETISNINLNNTFDENKIKANTIAPGTKGSFDIVLDATDSDVAVDYKVTFENCLNKPANLKFSYEGTKVNTLQELEDVLTGRIGLNDNRTKTLTINWEWEYETGDTDELKAENDRQDTEDAGKTFTFDINITGTQVNPVESE